MTNDKRAERELRNACRRFGIRDDFVDLLNVQYREDGVISVTTKTGIVYGRLGIEDGELLSRARKLILADRFGPRPIRPREGDAAKPERRTSQYRGVKWINGQWCASVRWNGEPIHIGEFGNDEEAAHEAAEQWFRENIHQSAR